MLTAPRSSRSSTSPDALNLHLHAKQWLAFLSIATEILYGGAAGGGKSFLMRVVAIVWCSAIPGLQVYLFRRIRDDLNKNHMEGPKGFRAMLAGWAAHGWCSIVEDEIRFWNGAKIYLCHCKDEKDIYKYQGAEIHVLLIDELTHFTETMYRFLRNRVRMVGITIPPQYEGQFPRILCGANPGNVGHLWVKATFVTSGIPMEMRSMPAEDGGMVRQYIPARLEDNPSMTEDDPGYEMRLEGLGSAALVQAMRWGDWDVVEGAFFDCWDRKRHVVTPFAIPEDWTRFRSGDWGSAKPFSFGWWAVVSDKFRVPDTSLWLPRGCLLRYREWYGMQPGKPNVGLKLHADKVGEGLATREAKDPKLVGGVLDPSTFAEDGGPPLAERINIELIKAKLVPFRPADNKRVPLRGAMGGWDQVRGRLVGDEDGLPMIVTFSTCVDSIRTIPALQHDALKPEDLDSDMEDHCFTAGTLVETNCGAVPIEHLPFTGRVYSLGGLKDYRSARMTRRNAKIVRLTFHNGVVVKCTEDHKFLVHLDEWRYAKDLTDLEVLCVPLSSAVRSKSLMESAITSAGATFSAKAFAFTSLCGNIIMDLYRAVGTSITPTMIAPTMTPAISNVSLFLSISEIGMAKRAGSAGAGASRGLTPLPPHGTDRQKASNGTLSITSSILGRQWIGAFLRSARNAAASIWSALCGSRKASSAVKIAGRVHCVSVEEAGRADVYCLTVPATGCFAIEGGMIVSNCADEWRYASMSRPWIRKPPAEEKKANVSGYKSSAETEKDSYKVW